MALASFPVVIHRYKRSVFQVGGYEAYGNLAEYLPKEIFDQRMATIRAIVKERYPHIYPETYMFMAAVVLVVATAALAILGRTLDIVIWFPLLILIAPAVLAYGTTRRRSQHQRRFLAFQDVLHLCLKDMTAQDLTHHVKWDYRRLREGDTAQLLNLSRPLSSWTVSLVVEAIQIDPEMDLNREMGEALPSYGDATRDIVLDIGTPIQDTVIQLREMDLADAGGSGAIARGSANNSASAAGAMIASVPPPDYHETAPPAYRPNNDADDSDDPSRPSSSSPTNTVPATTITTSNNNNNVANVASTTPATTFNN